MQIQRKRGKGWEKVATMVRSPFLDANVTPQQAYCYRARPTTGKARWTDPVCGTPAAARLVPRLR